MSRTGRSFAAAALLGAGVVGGYALKALDQPAAPAPASTALAATNLTTSNTATSSIDAATQQAFKTASPSVVYVNNVGNGTGSGVIFDSKGDIVTNEHVVSGAQTLKVTLNDGRTVSASVVGTDTPDDLAVIRIHASGLVPAHFAKAGTYGVAQTVLAIGNPLGLRQSVTSGLISGLHRTEQEPNNAYLPDAIQTSAPINPGNSGGALVALDGTVVGMPTLEQTSSSSGASAQAIGFAVPSERIVAMANQIIANGHVLHTGRAYLGIQLGSADNSSSSFYFGAPGGSNANVTGATVSTVASGSPASQAGIQQGDVITAANGTSISSSDDLLTVLALAKPGASMPLTINRGGSTVHVTVHLGELPATS